MTNLEMVQVALQATGSESSETVAAFTEKKFGVTVEAKFIPLYKASLLGRAMLARSPSDRLSKQSHPQLA